MCGTFIVYFQVIFVWILLTNFGVSVESSGFIIQNNKTLNNCTYFKFAALTRGDPLPLAGYLLTPIYIFGFVGGLLNLIVLLKMNSHCVWFLATMALSDILYFSFLFIHESNKFEALANNDWFSNFYAKSYPTVLSLVRWFSMTSFWSAVMVGVERLVAMMKPVSVDRVFSKKRSWVIIVLIFASNLLFQVFSWFDYSFETFPDCENSKNFRVFAVGTGSSGNPMRVSFLVVITITSFFQQFVHVTSTVVNDFGSFIVMLIINISLIYKLHEERSKYLQRFSSAKTRGAKKGRRSIMKR